MKKLLWLLCFALSGCASFHAEQVSPDGKRLSVDSNRIFIQGEVGQIDFDQTPSSMKVGVKGIKSQSQLDALDLLKTAAQLAK